MLVQLDIIRDHIVVTLIAVAVIMGGKTLSAAVGPALLGYSGRVALLAGVAVSQIGEFSFVLAKEGRVAGLLPDLLYQQFLGVAVITMLVTPFLLQGGPAILDTLEKVVPLDRLLPGFRPRELAPVHEQIKNHVVIAGYGLNGRNLAAALRSINAPYLIVELNAQTVRKARSEGEPAFYGDATRDEILHALGIPRARLFVIAISDPAATRRMVRVARELNPKLYIIARTRYVVEIPELTRLGANVVIPEEFETSIEILTAVLRHFHVPGNIIHAQARLLREERYSLLRGLKLPGSVMEQLDTILCQGICDTFLLLQHSPAVDRTLRDLGLFGDGGGAQVVALVRGGAATTTLEPSSVLRVGDILVMTGTHAAMEEAFQRLSPIPGSPP